jgi:hypothetical protein
MSLLEFGPRRWFSPIYKIVQNGAPIGEIHWAWGRQTLKIGSTNSVLGDEIQTACFLEEENGRRLVTVALPSGITGRLFTLPLGGKAYMLKAAFILGSAFVLLETVARSAPLCRRAFLGEALPIFLTVCHWRQGLL